MQNVWVHKDSAREPSKLGMPIVDPANWTPDEILANDERIYKLSSNEITEVKAAINTVIKSQIKKTILG